MIRVDPDDDDITLGEMLRQERFGAGMADQKNLDAEFARAVMTDGGFQVSCGMYFRSQNHGCLVLVERFRLYGR